jgi:hypothetical protein
VATISSPFDPKDEDKDKEAAQAGAAPPVVSSGETSTISATPQTAQATQGPSSSGRFTNLQKFIGANKDFNQQRGGLAGQITGNIGKSSQAAQQNVSGASKEFQDRASAIANTFRDQGFQAGWNPEVKQAQAVQPWTPAAATNSAIQPVSNTPTVAADANAGAPTAIPNGPTPVVPPSQGGPIPLDHANNLSQATAQPQNTGVLGKVFSNPLDLNEMEAAKVKAMRDAAYTGPKSFADLQGQRNLGALQVQTQNVGDLTKQASNEKGRFNLLNQMFGRQGYSGGQQKLDNLIIQGQQDQLGRLSASRRQAAQATNALRQGEASAQVQGKELTNEANQVRDTTRNVLNKSVLQTDQDLQQRVNDTQGELGAQRKAIYEGLKSGEIDPATLQKLGLSEGMNVYDVFQKDPLAFVHNGADPTKQAIASKQDYDRISRLKDLVGGAANEDASKALGQFGQYDPNSSFDASKYFNLDKGALENAIQQRKSDFERGSADTKRALDESTAAFTGDLTIKGGIKNAAAAKAQELRQKLAEMDRNSDVYNEYGGLVRGGRGATMDWLSGMSDQDLLRNWNKSGIASAGVAGANATTVPSDPIYTSTGSMNYAQLADAYDFEQNKMNETNAKYQELQKLYGANNVLRSKK